jgi:RNA polymerase sigma factor for flagellar operon FliA
VPKSVLIVDDEKATAFALAESLREEGFHTATAHSAAEAEAAHAARPADLVITDLRLPDLNGFELLCRLGAGGGGPLAIVISAWGGPEIDSSLRESGAIAYVRKPFDVERIKDLVARALAPASVSSACPDAMRSVEESDDDPNCRGPPRSTPPEAGPPVPRRLPRPGAAPSRPAPPAPSETARPAVPPAVPRAVAGRSLDHERVIQEVLAKYSPLVKYVVDKISATLPKTVDVADLQSSAVIGLYDAWAKFDSTRGTKFETYAVWRIRGAVLDELRASTGRPHHAPQGAQGRGGERDLDQKPGGRRATSRSRRPSGSTPGVLPALRRGAERGPPLARAPDPGDDSSDVMGRRGPRIRRACRLPPVGGARGGARDPPLGAINHLPEQERLVVALYYYEELTLKEIGEILGISESRGVPGAHEGDPPSSGAECRSSRRRCRKATTGGDRRQERGEAWRVGTDVVEEPGRDDRPV